MNGKQKGSSFERKICKALSLWITDGAREDCFWRSAMSGGRATVAGRKGTDLRRQAGDITATSPEGHKLTDHFYIECKHYRSLDYDLFLFGKGNLFKFWKVALREAQRYNKTPLLIVKQNRVQTMVLSELSCFLLGLAGVSIIRDQTEIVLLPFDKLVAFSFEKLYSQL